MSARFAYIAAAAGLVAVVAAINLTAPTATSYPDADAWAHVAALDEWASDIGDPGHSHLPLEVPSARFIPPFLPLAVTSAVTGWSALTAFAISGILATALIALVLYLFFRMMFPDEPWAPLGGLFAVVFIWGLPVPGSAIFELRSIIEVAGYPSAWAFVAGVAMVLAAVRATTGRLAWLGVVAALSAVAFLSHPIAAVFAYSLAFVVAIDRGWRAFLIPGLAAVGGIVIAFGWPFFSMVDVITEPLAFGEGDRLITRFYSPGRVLVMVGPALAGIYALTRLSGRRRVALSVGATAMAALWLGNIVVAVPVGDRFLVYTVFYLHVALVGWLVPVVRRLEPSSALAGALRLGAAALILGHALITITDVRGDRIELTGIRVVANYGAIGMVNQMEDIALAVPDDAVVVADPTTRWMLPAFSGKVISVSRDYFGVDSATARLADTDEFFSEAVTQQRRGELLATYGSELILFAPENVGDKVTADLEALGEVTVATPFFTLVTP